jgi:hypothetical protein
MLSRNGRTLCVFAGRTGGLPPIQSRRPLHAHGIDEGDLCANREIIHTELSLFDPALLEEKRSIDARQDPAMDGRREVITVHLDHDIGDA